MNILSECPQCKKGQIIAMVYKGTDELKRHCVEVLCNAGCRCVVTMTLEDLVKISHTKEFPPAPKTWFRNDAGQVLIGCRDCSSFTGMSPAVHTVKADGTVDPSWTCPHGCGFHVYIKLEDWTEHDKE